MSKLLSSLQLSIASGGSQLPRSISRELFPETDDPVAVKRNRVCTENMVDKNNHNARLLDQAADASAQSVAKTRERTVYMLEAGITRY
jgi:hypothetical protein